jgi:TetR/AcrR family transcriptional regulator, fatty acid metabolism regulator protein
MQSDAATSGQRSQTFIEAARRAQIVTAAIDTIAELGYGQASLARIAERAGTSKGVICYHFAGKDDLIREAAAEVLARGRAYLLPRVLAESSGAGALRAYLESNLAFMREYRNHVLAFLEIFLNARGDDGGPLVDRPAFDALLTTLEQLLARFQAAGEFRADFDPRVMAVAIRGAIDAVGRQLAADPDLDIDGYGRELASLFDRATRGKPDARPEEALNAATSTGALVTGSSNQRGRGGTSGGIT